ncbi:glycosyltransferase [Erythrobacter mangrovi]|uniref:Glycosyltransferase n=1 Tax=Erythrobacter mangrovi TaxID=2739433 RepID=A0A7D4CCP3_9SPHN|nr:glycosyltransferase [Erythrobacter mangrovi]QKG70929.1 glycosyltransferase [Erythrobacter mangrovi]
MSTGPAQAAPRRIALVWEQFAPYHVDRCEAVARRLRGRALVTGVEVASGSRRYAWAPSGPIDGVTKQTLVPGVDAEDIPRRRRHRALRDALPGHDVVILGLASSDPGTALLAWQLRRRGAAVFFCSDSKADDYRRHGAAEWLKRTLLRAYYGGILAGPRSHAYYRSLGLPAKRLWPGYDTLSNARLRHLAAGSEEPDFERRPFLFLGRFVPKKGLHLLLDAYTRYCASVPRPRGLVLAGAGPLQAELEAQAKDLGVEQRIRWTGFLGPQESAREMNAAFALVLPSVEEQWGLVVNEAVALGLPTIVSMQVGARDLLIRDGHNGFVVPTGASHALADAMTRMDGPAAKWLAMRDACAELAWFGDSERFADTIEAIAFPGNPEVEARIERLRAGEAG